MQDWIVRYSTLQDLFLLTIVVNLIWTFLFKGTKGSQPLDYHYHLDTRPGYHCGFKIPNYWDVVSNLIFAVFGLLGFALCCIYLPNKAMSEDEKNSWYAFFVGFFLVSFGSAYYHWRPNNWTLVWDRVPMTMAFMANYFTAQRVFLPASETSLIGNLILGLLSIFLWHCSLYLNTGSIKNVQCNFLGNQDGLGFTRPKAQEEIKKSNIIIRDQLIPYYAIQFFPLGCSLYMFLWWPVDADLKLFHILPTVGLYIVAKVLEILDLVSDQFFKKTMGGRISGHSLKHFTAGFATLSFMLYIINAKEKSF